MKNHENNLIQVFKYPLTLCVGVILVANLLGYICGTQTDFSDIENRYLTKRPAITFASLADGSFMETFETYSAEQIPFRNALVKGKSFMEMLLGKCENNGIARGEDDYLFDKTLATDDQADKNIKIIEKFIEDSGRDVVVAVAPTSVAIYPERLPKGMPVLDEASLYDSLCDELSECENAHVVDLFDVIKGHKNEDLYYRTDHHWKSMGAYYAYEAICDEIAGVHANMLSGAETNGGAEDYITAVDITSLTKHEANDFYGTFNAKYKGLGVPSDTIEYYDAPIDSYEADGERFESLYDESKLEIYDKYAMFMRGNPGYAKVAASNDGGGKSIIVFKDSYANCLIPYFVFNYDKIEVVDLRYFGGKVGELLSDNPDADILMLYNLSFINEDKHFFKLIK